MARGSFFMTQSNLFSYIKSADNLSQINRIGVLRAYLFFCLFEINLEESNDGKIARNTFTQYKIYPDQRKKAPQSKISYHPS